MCVSVIGERENMSSAYFYYSNNKRAGMVLLKKCYSNNKIGWKFNSKCAILFLQQDYQGCLTQTVWAINLIDLVENIFLKLKLEGFPF